MVHGEPASPDRRAIEALAQALYEAEDPARIAWAKRTTIVREAWLARARRQLQDARQATDVADDRVDEGKPI
jgi:hypothetical protein